MDDPIHETSGGPGPRRPYWVVGLVLLGLVMAMLAIAFVVDRQLRPLVGIEPGQTGSASAESPSMGAGAPAVAVQPAPAAPTTPPQGWGQRVATTPLEQEIEEAYRRYWDVYSDALLNLDTSRIPETATDDELRRIQEEVEGFRNRSIALRTRTTHEYVFLDVAPTEATVYDEALNRSFTVDPVTKGPSEGSDESEVLKDIYFFEQRDGVWKVVKSLRVYE